MTVQDGSIGKTEKAQINQKWKRKSTINITEMQRTTKDYYEYLYQQIGQPRRNRNIPTKQTFSQERGILEETENMGTSWSDLAVAAVTSKDIESVTWKPHNKQVRTRSFTDKF